MFKSKVVFFPYENRCYSRNKFANNLMDALRINFDVVRMEAVSVDAERLRNVKAAVLNWIEYFLDDSMKTRIMFYKEYGIKIIWVFHNRLPHECSGCEEKEKEKMMWIADHCDAIILLSKSSVQYLPEKNRKKTHYVPHPLYSICKPSDFSNFAGQKRFFTNGYITVGFLGLIRPYKQIELLLRLAKEININLIVAGFAAIPEYADDMKKCAADLDNVFFTAEKISDSDFSLYHLQSDLIVLPYDTRSAMNSGSMMMAFSYSKPVLVTDIAMAQDLKDKVFVHMVQGNSDGEIEEKIRLKLEECILLGSERLREQGQQARKYVEANNNLAVVAENLRTVIE